MGVGTHGLLAVFVEDPADGEVGSYRLSWWRDLESLASSRAKQGTTLPILVLPASNAGAVELEAMTRAFVDYVVSTETTCVVGIRPSGQISFCNEAFCQLIRTPRSELAGPVWPWLTQPDADAMRRWLDASNLPTRAYVNFVDAHHRPRTRACTITRTEGILLIGEPLVDKEQDADREIRTLNNELAVLGREHARKSKALEKALRDLKSAEALLVHTEKMASLGKMTAGVAHEINNPLAFVSSNHHRLSRDFEELLRLVHTVMEAMPEIRRGLPALHERVASLASQMRLERLMEGVPRRLESSSEGLERIRQTVLDLRTFSRVDEAQRKEVDLADSLRATLRFLEPLCSKHGVRVEPHFEKLPPTLCAPQALNQAFANVVSNAIQASKQGMTVRAYLLEEQAHHVIRVVDEGVGIRPEDFGRLFDPFFTTKPVGDGTGLGLSIAHQVVEDHGGTIHITSELGAGTTVTIRVPVGIAPPRKERHE